MNTWIWAIGAFALVLGAAFIPAIGGTVVAPIVSLLVGAAAAYWLLRAPGRTLAQAVGAGAIAGVGALFAGVVAFTVLGLVLGSDPAVQELVRGGEPHPEARVPYAWIPSLGAALGDFVGIGAGLVNLVMAVIGGLAAGLATSPARRSLRQAIG